MCPEIRFVPDSEPVLIKMYEPTKSGKQCSPGGDISKPMDADIKDCHSTVTGSREEAKAAELGKESVHSQRKHERKDTEIEEDKLRHIDKNEDAVKDGKKEKRDIQKQSTNFKKDIPSYQDRQISVEIEKEFHDFIYGQKVKKTDDSNEGEVNASNELGERTKEKDKDQTAMTDTGQNKVIEEDKDQAKSNETNMEVDEEVRKDKEKQTDTSIVGEGNVVANEIQKSKQVEVIDLEKWGSEKNNKSKRATGLPDRETLSVDMVDSLLQCTDKSDSLLECKENLLPDSDQESLPQSPTSREKPTMEMKDNQPSEKSCAIIDISKAKVHTGTDVSEGKKQPDSTDSEGKQLVVKHVNSEITEAAKKTPEPRSYFKLGMEGSYVMYENQYATNSLASSKQDHQVERDKRRSLGNKFRLYDFKWLGEIYQGPALVVNTLRSTLLTFESSIPTAFLHPMWYRQLPVWIKAVRMCKEVSEFASLLLYLEEMIKPLVVLNVWRDSIGHVLFSRMHGETKGKKGSKDRRERERDFDVEDSDEEFDEEKEEGKLKYLVFLSRGDILLFLHSSWAV